MQYKIEITSDKEYAKITNEDLDDKFVTIRGYDDEASLKEVLEAHDQAYKKAVDN